MYFKCWGFLYIVLSILLWLCFACVKNLNLLSTNLWSLSISLPLKTLVSSMLLFNPLNPELNPICYLLALLGAYHFLHVSRIRVKHAAYFFYVRKGCTGTGVGVEGFVSLSQVLFRQHVSTYKVIFRSYTSRKAVSL